jgi:oligopeptide transport system substrate-binding protein
MRADGQTVLFARRPNLRGEESAQRGLLPVLLGTLIAAVLALGCTNRPYADEESHEPILYVPYGEPPKTLDPAVAYSTADHVVTGKVYDTLLDYHYLKRPFELIGGLAEHVPEAEPLEGGRVRYQFRLREDLRFARDACFEEGPKDPARFTEDGARRVLATDFLFSLSRVADPAVGSPVVEPLSHIDGLVAWGERLAARRKNDAEFAKRRVSQQYQEIGALSGFEVLSDREFAITLHSPYPQILYWFAMPFTTPMAFEAVDYYTGEGGRPSLDEHAVGTGPFVLKRYDKRARIVLEKNPDWYGVRHPEWRAPAATFPSLEGVTGLSAANIEDFAPLAGRSLPMLTRIEMRREEETIPTFGKFMQGYYDTSGIARESFNRVVHEGGLSAEMAERGMRLEKSVVPAVFYLGFNMDDPVVGSAAGERSRLLRQAMSLVTNSEEYCRLFLNGRGLPAQSPLPPGLFGYEEDYKNPYRTLNFEEARRLLAQAGYPGGIDPKTKRPLKLTFDVADTSPESRVRFLFWTNQWRKLGINVELSATNYNKFQEKVRDGAYQIFQWGWVADYPDPENFLFLLTGPMARSASGGPNTANFSDPEFDALFGTMKTMENTEERLEVIRKMRAILERERPWIELFHPEEYALAHGWLRGVKPAGLSIATTKYYGVDAVAREQARREWNRPILWPAWVFLALLAGLIGPLIGRYLKERT